jgi:xylulokinase
MNGTAPVAASRTPCTIGVDIGTSSSKGVLVALDGEVLASAAMAHEVMRPGPGLVEMDGRSWWCEFIELTRRLLASAGSAIDISGVGVSGVGPCVLLTDDDDEPVRPAILYGVDTRSTEQISRMTSELGVDEIVRVGGSRLSTQAAGPKIRWIAENEPEEFGRAARLFMPASWLARKLTGAYVLDHQSASQTNPLYRVEEGQWHDEWWQRFAPGILRPELGWAGGVAGGVTAEAAALTGIPEGTPVTIGTIDAWSEAASVGADGPGDLMLMYGTTMFLIATGEHALRSPSMWTTVGVTEGTRNLAGGLATSGAITDWIRRLTQADYPTLIAEATASGPGARGLLMLPYFAGERTPILDPDARGVIAGLTVSHTRGDLYRAALESTAMAVRHNIETMRDAGADIRRVVAVGGGTHSDLWMQIVSNVTGLVQEVPRVTLGASYGSAFLAAIAVCDRGPSIADWNPVERLITPDPAQRGLYDDLYVRYRRLYDASSDIVHELVDTQR